MKKKNIIKTGLLSAALLLGTGYAVINSKQVTINGTVSSEIREMNIVLYPGQNDDFDVEVSGNVVTVTQNVPFSHGESKTFTLRVENPENDLNMVVSLKKLTFESQYYSINSIMATIDGEKHVELLENNNSLSYAPGNTGTIEVTITMDELPITEEESNLEFKIELSFAPAKEEN